MDQDHCQFHQLPFSKLFNTYTSDYQKLEKYFTVNPFDEEAFVEKAASITSGAYKKQYAEELESYHELLGIEEKQAELRKKLADPESLAIVTGQQLGVFGGPLFTVYKTITTILKARELEEKLNKPVAPVFWLADEDHDFEEIAWLGIPDYDVFKKLTLSQEGDGSPVADQQIKASIEGFLNEVKSEQHDTDFSDELFGKLESLYQPGKLHVQAFAQLINHWFGDEGLLIAGSNFKSIKEIAPEVFSTSVTKAREIFNSLESQSSELEKDFHRQVIVGDSNLFYLNKDKKRIKFERSEDTWIAGDIELKSNELVDLIHEEPENFSPNVFLRPVLQDFLLPTVAYVAGPGELAYYAQMKELYPHFGLEMPAILPRLSITLIESGIERIMEKLPFPMCSYNQRIEDLESAYVDQANTFDVEGVFGEWKQKLEEIGEEPTDFIKEIDPTLEGATGKVIAGFGNEIDKLKGKVYRSIKQQEETQLKRIAKIQSQLFPDGLQERSVSPVYFMNKYGTDLWIRMLNYFGKQDLDVQKHHIVKL